jgi:hypothetical protein
MGLSSKSQKTETTQKQEQHATTTPNVPDWIQQPAQKLAGQIGEWTGQAGAFTPETNDLQRQTWAKAGQLTGPDFSASRGLLNGVTPVTPERISSGDVQGESLLTNLEAYYNPFKDQITNPVLNDYDFQSDQTRAAQAAAAAKNGAAFRGSRYGVQEGETEGALARGRAATEGGLLKDMFSESTRLSASDADRRQQAALANQNAKLTADQSNQGAFQRAGEFNTTTDLNRAGALAGLETSEGSEDRANLGAQAALGQGQFEIENAIKQFPLEYQKQLEGLLAGLNPALFTGQTVDGTMTGTGSSTTTANQSLGSWLGDWLLASAGGASSAAKAAAGAPA